MSRWSRFGAAVIAATVLAAAVVACGGSSSPSPTAAPPSATAMTMAVGQAGDITVFAPAVPAPATTDVAALYFTVKNAGAQDDRLMSVTTDASSGAEVHETVTQNSTSVMRPVQGGLVVPAHGEVALAPGGYHVMMMPLTRTLEAGGSVQVTLTFEHAGALSFTAPVTTYGGMSMPMGSATAAP